MFYLCYMKNPGHILLMAMTMLLAACQEKDNPDRSDGKVTVQVVLDEAGLIEYGGPGLGDKYRGVVETKSLHQEVELEKTADGTFQFTLSDMPKVDTDIYLWVDGGVFYDASYLNSVTLDTKNYIPYDKTREAFFGHVSVKPSAKGITAGIQTKTPYAPYRILASDVEAYGKMQKANDWPDIKDLQVRVSYIGYLPCSFDVMAGRPNDAVRGVSFVRGITFLSDGTPVLAEDKVLVNGTSTNVSVKIEIINPANGEVISSSGELALSCRYGSRTIAEGDILSAGVVDGAVGIDTRWEGVFDINF